MSKSAGGRKATKGLASIRAMSAVKALSPLWAAVCIGLLAVSVQAQTPIAPGSPTRGRLLYETHCIGCHSSQMHWRDQRIVKDWDGLVREVERWQARANLAWSPEDVLEVARHLNDIVYRVEPPVPPRPLARVHRHGAAG